jgi:hypothetical protein
VLIACLEVSIGERMPGRGCIPWMNDTIVLSTRVYILYTVDERYYSTQYSSIYTIYRG